MITDSILLTLVRAVVGLHGGEIKEYGEGLCVHITHAPESGCKYRCIIAWDPQRWGTLDPAHTNSCWHNCSFDTTHDLVWFLRSYLKPQKGASFYSISSDPIQISGVQRSGS
jgi:hypothetical protein